MGYCCRLHSAMRFASMGFRLSKGVVYGALIPMGTQLMKTCSPMSVRTAIPNHPIKSSIRRRFLLSLKSNSLELTVHDIQRYKHSPLSGVCV